MLAGCSSTLLSPRHRLRIVEASLLDMGTQRFDLPCSSFSRKETPRISLSLEKPMEARGSCSFRLNPLTTASSSSSSLVAQSLPREAAKEVEVDRFKKKRFYDSSFQDDDDEDHIPSKRVRTTGEDITYPTMEAEFYTPFPPSTNSGSSSDNNTHCTSSQNQNEDTSETETGNGSHPLHPIDGESGRLEQQQSAELFNLLMACVESVSSGNHVATNYFIAKLGELASPVGTPVHRIVAYYTEALALRVAKLWPHVFCVAPPCDIAGDEDDTMGMRILNNVTPIPKFIHFTMNEMILRAFEGKNRVHIIDFDIKQGLQWPGLFQSLASRPNPPTHVRITGIGDSKQELHKTGVRLAELAKALCLPFEFHAVVDRLEDVRFWMLHIKEGECVAVNCALQLHKALYDGGVLSDFLGLIRSTSPTVVVLAEQEAEHNDQMWEARVAASLPRYAAIFDALDMAGMAEDSPARVRVEWMFGREIGNIVACEGRERTERHEGFREWRRVMEETGGLRCVGVGEREVMQGRMLLKMFPSGGNYSLVKQGELGDGRGAGVTLKWMDQPLYTVSAWAPADVVASSNKIGD